MKDNRFPIKRIAYDGVLAAIFFALSFLSVEIGGVKLTFDSLAVTVSAMLFGPVDGLAVGLMGAFLEQMVRYGFTATTVLWIIPPALRGLAIGLGVRLFPKKLSLSYIWNRRRPYLYLGVCIAAAVLTSIGNTIVYYIDAKMYGYYSYELIFGVFFVRILTGIASGTVTAVVAIPILKAIGLILPGQTNCKSSDGQPIADLRETGAKSGDSTPDAGITADKRTLRSAVRKQRAALSDEEIRAASDILTQKLLSHPAYRSCKTLYVYMSYKSEVRTDKIVDAALADGKVVAIPKVEGDHLAFYRIKSLDDAVPGFKGIPEPDASCDPINDRDALVLTPGLAFDAEGRRLGYGGGFYDRFLISEPHPTIAICYDLQLVDRVPANDLDVPIDYVLTPSSPAND